MNLLIPYEKKMVSVEHPAQVQNVDRALDTLGGLEEIQKVYENPSTRLSLHWRPSDPYCKPSYADRLDTSSFVLKVRRRKGASSNEEVTAEVIGVLSAVFKFNALNDYQYLPMKYDSNSYTSLLPQLRLDDLGNSAWVDADAPLFLPPPVFCRTSTHLDYSYRDPPASRIKSTDLEKTQMIHFARKRRKHFTIFKNFEDEKCPSKPLGQAVDKMKLLQTSEKIQETYKQIEKAFEGRPIWSRAALEYHYDLSPDQIKIFLPTIAYYYLTGPWRSLWVRLGYDPTKHPESKIYQLIDYRIRQSLVSARTIKCKRNKSYRLTTRASCSTQPSGASLISQKVLGSQGDPTDEPKTSCKSDAVFKFRPGYVPTHRQMFYQLCDVHVDEIQQLLHQNDDQEIECLDKDGWCVPGMQNMCREIIHKHIAQVRDNLANENDEQSSVDEQSTNLAAAGSAGIFDEDDDDDDDDDNDEDEEDFMRQAEILNDEEEELDFESEILIGGKISE